MQEILILIGKSTYFYDKGNTKAEKELTMLKEREGGLSPSSLSFIAFICYL